MRVIGELEMSSLKIAVEERTEQSRQYGALGDADHLAIVVIPDLRSGILSPIRPNLYLPAYLDDVLGDMFLEERHDILLGSKRVHNLSTSYACHLRPVNRSHSTNLVDEDRMAQCRRQLSCRFEEMGVVLCRASVTVRGK